MPKDFNEDLITEALGDVNKAFEEFKSKNDEFQLETKKGFEDIVRKEELDRINTAMNESQKKLDEFAARMKRLAQQETKGEGAEDLDKKAQQWAALNAHRNGTRLNEKFGAEELGSYRKAFERYLRVKDSRMLEADEMKALSVGSDPDAGYTVMPDTSGRMVDRIFETSPVRQYAAVQMIGTDALEGSHDIDEASVGWVNETASRTSTDTPQLDKWRIPVHEMYAKPEATQKLIDDASIDMIGWLQNKVADKMGRFEATSFVNGDGIGKPRGFLTYADWTTAGTYQLGAIEQFDSGANGAFAAAPDGGDVLLTALYGLKAQYRANATWFMNRSTTSTVRKLKDSDGAYIWQPGSQAGQPALLLGYPVASFEDMPDLGKGTLSVAVGDMARAYQIVDRQGFRLLIDPYSNKPYVQYYTTRRVGGDVVDFDALKLINFKS